MRQGLIACITCELLALATWIGGLLVLVAAVIPAVFNTFGGQDTGGFFDPRLRRIQPVGARRSGHSRRGHSLESLDVSKGQAEQEITRTEWLLLGAMLLTAGVITFVLHPQAAALQAQAFASKVKRRESGLRGLFQLHKPVRCCIS